MTKRVGLAAPHPAAHKCAIVPFRLPKRLFAYVFAESLHDFAKQGHKRPGMRTAARFFWYSAREMFHAVVKVKHYILWSARPPYLQKILENLTFVLFLPLSPASDAPELDKIMILAYFSAGEQKSATFCAKMRNSRKWP